MRSQAPSSCSNEQNRSMNAVHECVLDSLPKSSPPTHHEHEKLSDFHKDRVSSTPKMALTASASMSTEMIQHCSMPDISISRSSNHTSAPLLDGKESEPCTIVEEDEHHVRTILFWDK